MFTRREVMLGAITAGAAALAWRPNVALASASQPSTPVNFAVPEGACDCHVHTFDPQHFPYSPSRPYTPEPVSVEELRSLHKALHMSRVIVVQTTVYGTDNSGVLDAMKKLGPRARGVAVIDEKTPDSALDEMDRAGIRGIRLNLETAGPDRSRNRPQAFSSGGGENQEQEMAHSDLRAAIRDRGNQGSGRGGADAGGLRSLRGNASSARRRSARLQFLVEPAPNRQSLRENFRAVSQLHTRAGLSRCCADRQGDGRRESAANFVGQRLAAPGNPRARPQQRRNHAILSNRRRPGSEFTSHVGSRRGHAQNDPGGKSRQALRILSLQ